MVKRLPLYLTLLLLLLAIPGTTICLAQQNNLPEKGEHVAYDHLKAYEGKWRYKAGKKTFTVNLVLQKNRVGNDAFYVYMDQLEGEIAYTTKGKQAIATDTTEKHIKSKAQERNDRVILIFMDPVKQKSGEVTLRFADTGQTQLHWELTEPAELLVRSINKKHAPGFSIPTNMVLKRVE